jgi:predicted DNA-binding transcriptional regulator AlpA
MTAPITSRKRVLRPKQAAEFCGDLTEDAMGKMRSSGIGPPFVKLGKRRVGYLLEDLEAWLESRRRTSTADRGPA